MYIYARQVTLGYCLICLNRRDSTFELTYIENRSRSLGFCEHATKLCGLESSLWCRLISFIDAHNQLGFYWCDSGSFPTTYLRVNNRGICK